MPGVGHLPKKLLFRKAPMTLKSVQDLDFLHGPPPEFDKTLLRKVPYNIVARYRGSKLEVTWKLLVC